MKDTQKKLYISCPYCGKILCKATPGSEIENKCSQCKNDIEAIVDENNCITTRLIQQSA